jgi:hypothetical protein
MKKETVDIKFGEQELTVSGIYSPPYFGDRETPPEPATFEVDEVFYKGIDVSPLISELDDELFVKIENECITNMQDKDGNEFWE